MYKYKITDATDGDMMMYTHIPVLQYTLNVDKTRLAIGILADEFGKGAGGLFWGGHAITLYHLVDFILASTDNCPEVIRGMDYLDGFKLDLGIYLGFSRIPHSVKAYKQHTLNSVFDFINLESEAARISQTTSFDNLCVVGYPTVNAMGLRRRRLVDVPKSSQAIQGAIDRNMVRVDCCIKVARMRVQHAIKLEARQKEQIKHTQAPALEEQDIINGERHVQEEREERYKARKQERKNLKGNT